MVTHTHCYPLYIHVAVTSLICMQGDLTDDVDATPAPHGQRHWPWSGRVRHFIYIDFSFYLALLIMFCITTLSSNTFRSYDSYHLVQSIQKALLEEVRPT
jgi:hypothetical protein